MFNCGHAWHGFSGFGSIGMWITHILFWILIITGIILVIKAIRNHGNKETINDNSVALEILKKRYAKGEIDKEEFEKKKADLD